MSLRRSKPRPPLRPVNATDSIRVPKLKTAQTAPKPQQATHNASTVPAEAVLKAALANENEMRVNESANEAASEAEEPRQSKQETKESPTMLAREVSLEASGETVYPSFEEIFGWDWGRMQRELKQLSVAMQQSNPAAADFLRRCILRIDVLMELPSQPNDDGEEGADAVLTSYAAKTPQQLEPTERDDYNDGTTEEQQLDSTAEETAELKQVPMQSSPWREIPMRFAAEEEEQEEVPATLEKPTMLETQLTLPPEFAPTPAHLQRADTDDSTAAGELVRGESNDCASPEVRGTMFDDEDEESKPAASNKTRGGRKKQEKPKPVARRRSLRVAKATQRFDVHDDFAEAEQQNVAAVVVSPVKMTEEASSYCSPEPKSHAARAAANDNCEQEQQGEEEEEAVDANHESATEVSPASSDGGLATVMSSLTLADNMASSAMQGTPFQRESARKPKVKRLRLNSTTGKTTMAAFETPSKFADDSSYATEVNAKQQKRRRARVDAPLTSEQSGFVPTPVTRPEEAKEEEHKEQKQQQTVEAPPAPEISVSLTTSDVLSFLPAQSSVGELTSGALVLMFGAAAMRALCDTKTDELAVSLQTIVDAYWQMCQKCANSATRCLSPTSSVSSSSGSPSATQPKKKKSVRFCADVSGVCPINDRETSTVHQASASISALEQYLQKLSEFRKGTAASSNACALLAQVLLQTSQRHRELSRQFHAMATELLGERHSITFAEEAARDAVAELEDRPMGIQRPLHYRLTWLCSSAVRYHLRFLLDPPPPSPSVPPVTGYQPPYNRRSSLHRKICLDQPTVAQEWIQCTGSDPKPEWSLSSSVMHALWQFHTALTRVAADDSELPAHELSRSDFSCWLRQQSAKLTSDWIETGTGAERLHRAQLLMAAEVAREFLFHVFSHEDVVAAAAECGAFPELERFAEMLLCAEGVDGDDSHLTLLVHISELVSVIGQPLCSASDMQRFRTMLAQHHSVCGPRPPKKKLAELGLTADDVTEITSLLVESPYVFEYPSIVGSEAG